MLELETIVVMRTGDKKHCVVVLMAHRKTAALRAVQPGQVVVHRLSDSGGRDNRLDQSNACNRCSGGGRAIAVDFGLGTVGGDMAGFTASVACLSSGVERAAIRSRAIAGDVAELSTSITLHSLRLAITGKMVRSAALVAGSRASTASKAAPEGSPKATTCRSPSATAGHAWVRAVAGEMA